MFGSGVVTASSGGIGTISTDCFKCMDALKSLPPLNGTVTDNYQLWYDTFTNVLTVFNFRNVVTESYLAAASKRRTTFGGVGALEDDVTDVDGVTSVASVGSGVEDDYDEVVPYSRDAPAGLVFTAEQQKIIDADAARKTAARQKTITVAAGKAKAASVAAATAASEKLVKVRTSAAIYHSMHLSLGATIKSVVNSVPVGNAALLLSAIKHHYAKHTVAALEAARLKFITDKMKSNEDMISYTSRMVQHRTIISDYGGVTDDATFLMYLYAGIGGTTEYLTLITTLQLNKASVDDVIEALQTFYTNLKIRKNGIGVTAIAASVTRNFNGRGTTGGGTGANKGNNGKSKHSKSNSKNRHGKHTGGGNSTGSLTCYLCGAPGHTVRDCPVKDKYANTKCDDCSEIGHIKAGCRARKAAAGGGTTSGSSGGTGGTTGTGAATAPTRSERKQWRKGSAKAITGTAVNGGAADACHHSLVVITDVALALSAITGGNADGVFTALLDSGASTHVTRHRGILSDTVSAPPVNFQTAGNGVYRSTITGTSHLSIVNTTGATVSFSGVRYCKGISADLLLSVSQIIDNGGKVTFNTTGATVKTTAGTNVYFNRSGGVYMLRVRSNGVLDGGSSSDTDDDTTGAGTALSAVSTGTGTSNGVIGLITSGNVAPVESDTDCSDDDSTPAFAVPVVTTAVSTPVKSVAVVTGDVTPLTPNTVSITSMVKYLDPDAIELFRNHYIKVAARGGTLVSDGALTTAKHAGTITATGATTTDITGAQIKHVIRAEKYVSAYVKGGMPHVLNRATPLTVAAVKGMSLKVQREWCSLQLMHEHVVFDIRPSKQGPDAGNGLFSLVMFPGPTGNRSTGGSVLQYTGAIITADAVAALDKVPGGLTYVAKYSKNDFIDAVDPTVGGLARFVNTSLNSSDWNVKLVTHSGALWWNNIKTINVGDELIGSYNRDHDVDFGLSVAGVTAPLTGLVVPVGTSGTLTSGTLTDTTSGVVVLATDSSVDSGAGDTDSDTTSGSFDIIRGVSRISVGSVGTAGCTSTGAVTDRINGSVVSVKTNGVTVVPIEVPGRSTSELTVSSVDSMVTSTVASGGNVTGSGGVKKTVSFAPCNTVCTVDRSFGTVNATMLTGMSDTGLTGGSVSTGAGIVAAARGGTGGTTGVTGTFPYVATGKLTPSQLLHLRYGHLSRTSLQALCGSSAVTGITDALKVDEIAPCGTCLQAKSKRKPFADVMSGVTVTAPMHKISVDFAGPVRFGDDVTDKGYLLVIVDSFSKMMFTYPFDSKHSGPVSDTIISFIKFGEKQTGNKLKHFHSDSGGEFIDSVLVHYLKENGVLKTLTMTDTPQHNSGVERRNGVIFAMIRCLLYHAGLPNSFCWDAAATATYIINRSVTKGSGVTGVTPLELFVGTGKPSVKHFRVFGSDVIIKDTKVVGKLQVRGAKGILVGYDTVRGATTGYKVYVVNDNITVTSRDVDIIENSFVHAEMLRQQCVSNDYAPISIYDSTATYGIVTDNEMFDTETRLAIEISKNESGTGGTTAVSGVSSDSTTSSVPVTSTVSVGSSTGSGVITNTNNTTGGIGTGGISTGSIGISGGNATTTGKTSVKLADVDSSNIIGGTDGGRSVRVRSTTNRYGMTSAADIGAFTFEQVLIAIGVVDPATFNEAMGSEHASDWLRAMVDEYISLVSNGVWVVVPLPDGATTVGGKWVFKSKTDATGVVTRRKARLVVQGCSQTDDSFDADKISVPVMSYDSLRLLLSYAVTLNFELEQMDVVTAFLNSGVQDHIYMRPPPGFDIVTNAASKVGVNDDGVTGVGTNGGTTGTRMVCKLIKSLYGLKQSPFNWHRLLHTFLVSQGWYNLLSDPCIYKQRGTVTGTMMLLGVFVDDIISTYSKGDIVQYLAFKTAFTTRFKVTDLGNATFILGMSITRNRDAGTLFISQQGYINKVLETFRMNDAKPALTPSDPSISLTNIGVSGSNGVTGGNGTSGATGSSTNGGTGGTTTVTVGTLEDDSDYRSYCTSMDAIPYLKLVGCLNYLARSTRIDICHAVLVVSQQMAAPQVVHWRMAKYILRYLKGTSDYGLLYTAGKGITVTGTGHATYATTKVKPKPAKVLLKFGCVKVHGTPTNTIASAAVKHNISEYATASGLTAATAIDVDTDTIGSGTTGTGTNSGFYSIFTPKAYSDANFGGAARNSVSNVNTDWRSTQGILIQVGGNTVVGPDGISRGGNSIIWKSSDQTVVAQSSCESEWIAGCSAANSLVWTKSWLSEIGVNVTAPMVLYIDNQAAIAVAKQLYNGRVLRHVAIPYHLLRTLTTSKVVAPEYINTKSQLSDIFTKPLKSVVFGGLRDQLVVSGATLGKVGTGTDTTRKVGTAGNNGFDSFIGSTVTTDISNSTNNGDVNVNNVD